MESKETFETVKSTDKIPMNILICGSKIEKVNIQQLFNDQVKKTLKNKTDYEEYIYHYDWKFDFFKEGLGDNQLKKVDSKLVQDFKDKDFRDLIICFIEDSETNLQKTIDYFSKMNPNYHTFIIFVTTNKEINRKKVNDIIDDLEEDYDSRNIELLYFDRDFIIKFFEILFKKACYFNEFGNEMVIPDINSTTFEIKNGQKHSFNILIIGKPGCGKSTLINIFNGSKVAKEGTGGGKVTYKICKYNVENTNFVIYDTPGFGTNDELPKVVNYVTKQIEDMEKIQEKFYCILYLLNNNDTRDFDEPEANLIKFLLKLNVPFYFLLNWSRRPKEVKGKKKHKDKKKIILEEHIKTYFGSNSGIKVLNLNLRENDTENYFGLNLLFKDLYEHYKSSILDLNELKARSDENIREIVKQSKFFDGLTTKEKILENIIFKCNLEILAFSTSAGAVGFIPIPFSDFPILLGIQTSMVIAIALHFGIELEKSKAKDIVLSLFKSSVVGGVVGVAGKLIGSFIKTIPGIGTAVGGAICGSTAALGTFSLGKAAISFFTPQFDEKKFYLERAQSFNKTIDKLKEFGEKFKDDENYLLINSH